MVVSWNPAGLVPLGSVVMVDGVERLPVWPGGAEQDRRFPSSTRRSDRDPALEAPTAASKSARPVGGHETDDGSASLKSPGSLRGKGWSWAAHAPNIARICRDGQRRTLPAPRRCGEASRPDTGPIR